MPYRAHGQAAPRPKNRAPRPLPRGAYKACGQAVSLLNGLPPPPSLTWHARPGGAGPLPHDGRHEGQAGKVQLGVLPVVAPLQHSVPLILELMRQWEGEQIGLLGKKGVEALMDRSVRPSALPWWHQYQAQWYA